MRDQVRDKLDFAFTDMGEYGGPLAGDDLFSGRHEEARRRLRRALDLDPNTLFALGYLDISYAFGGDL